MAIFTKPLSMSFSPSTVCMREWWAAHSFSILGSTARPSAVSTTPPRLRLSRVTFSSFSNACTAWLTADWVKLISAAALEKLPHSTVFKNIWYLFTLMGTTVLSRLL